MSPAAMDTLTNEERKQLEQLIDKLGDGVVEVKLITFDKIEWFLVGMKVGLPVLKSFKIEEANQLALLRRVFPVDLVPTISMETFKAKFRQWKIEAVLATSE